ncbi:MAG: response regulator [Candidatus Lokiarchaeota archaeon]|nr:response regulator [Candidatus Lokiarchaeota archaeon]
MASSGVSAQSSKKGNKEDKHRLNDEDIQSLDRNSEKVKQLMVQYEEETTKYAIWRGAITEGFIKWLKGEKVYTRAKERISLYVEDKVKSDWQDFIDVNEDFPTFSELIRRSVNTFIEDSGRVSNELSKLNPSTISNISHALKEPLTSIKGYSQLLLESDEYKDKLSDHIEETIKNIFDQSNLLENIIKNFLDNIKPDGNPYDILLIEDDLPTIRLITNYFENKEYICKGVASGTKGLEELKRTAPKVILLDIILPDISGYDICHTIKTDNIFKKIPVFFLTAISESEVKKKFPTSLADGYILKPFNFSDFDIIFKILNGKAN